MPTSSPAAMLTRLCSALLAVGACAQVQAQSSVTIYGSLDQYLNYMHSSSGATVKALEDGALLRSRLGFRGVEDLGGGLSAKFQLEHGLNADNGTAADAGNNRFFDRQAWVGIGNRFGDIRLGRQNGAIFTRGAFVDYTTRTLGSMVNNFGVPSRYDNTVSFVSSRLGGFQGDIYVSAPENPTFGNRPFIYQVGLDYATSNYRVGYAGLRARPPRNAAVDKDVAYDMLFANWMYGKGTVYATFVRSNNNTASGGINNAAQILGNTGGAPGGAGSFNPGTAGLATDLGNFYNVWQLSADYQLTPQLRLGALWGVIDDRSARDRGASGGSIGAYYDFSKRTTLMAMLTTLRNDDNGGWRPAASGGVKTTFTNAGDVNGRTINGAHLGVIHRF